MYKVESYFLSAICTHTYQLDLGPVTKLKLLTYCFDFEPDGKLNVNITCTNTEHVSILLQIKQK